MKTLLTLVSFLLLSSVFSQSNEFYIKNSIFQLVNSMRSEKKIGLIDTTFESNDICKKFYELKDNVDKNKIIFKTGYSDQWAAYDCQKLTIFISKTESNPKQFIDSSFKNTNFFKNNCVFLKWYSFDNTKYSKPVFLGLYVKNITEDNQKHYYTYDIYIMSIKNVPEIEKCVLLYN